MMRTIVSLTTYGERITKTLPKTLDSLHKMMNPDITYIYVSETDAVKIDESLIKTYPDVTPVTVPDIKSFKKYFVLTNPEHNTDNVFVTDDDIVFSPDTWKNLTDLHNRHENETQQYIYACGCTIYDERTNTYHTPNDNTPYERFLFWSGCGLLIPPHTLRFDRQTLTDMYGYITRQNPNAYTSDDKFISAYARKQNVKCVCSCTKQHYLDFDGNIKLADSRRGKSKLHAQQAATYFDLERDHITVSVAPKRPNADRINALNNQTLPPERIIVTVKPDTRISDKLKSVPNVTIQYDDNPNTKRFTPDTDPNDLVFLIPDTDIPNNTIEQMYSDYYSSKNGYIHTDPIRFTHTEQYGCKPTPNPTRNVFRRKHTDNLPNTEPDSFIQTILNNSR